MRIKPLMILWLFLAVLCAIYGIAVLAVGSGTLFFTAWLLTGLFFALLALGVVLEWWTKLPGAVKGIFIGLVVLGIGSLILVETCVAKGFREHGTAGLDYIIVLGAQVHEDGPAPVLRYRLDAAKEYMEENPNTICVVSGGQGYNEPEAEAFVMKEYLEEKGVSADRIILETDSATTAENLENCAELINPHAAVGIVTNDFHLFRAMKMAKKAGYDHCCGIAAGSNKLFLPNNMYREYFAIMKMLVSGKGLIRW